MNKLVSLMTHTVVGYPDLESTEKIVDALIEGGSSFIELQIPFSDPIADGNTIMHACEIALHNGSTVEKAFNLFQKISRKSNIPLIAMCYYNTILNYGVENFCRKARQTGISGLIVPDIPPEEEIHEHLISLCLKNNLYLIRVISPASTVERLKINATVAKGFVYCVSRFGVTGAKSDLNPQLKTYLQTVKKYFQIPIAVGFGISKREHIDKLKNLADIFIIGSAIIDLIENNKDDYLNKIVNFIGKLSH